MTKQRFKTANQRFRDTPKWKIPVDINVSFMQTDAWENGGMAAVTFLGRTWATRGVKYWVKRSLATLLYLLCLAAVGAMTYGFGIGFLCSTSAFVLYVLFPLWALTAVPGLFSRFDTCVVM